MTSKSLIAPLLVALGLSLPTAIVTLSPEAWSQVPATIQNNELAMRAYMVEVSEQLGVTCNYCHDLKNLKSDDKRAFKVAKDHMRIVDVLYNDGFEKRMKVDCRMCHRGEAKPRLNISFANMKAPEVKVDSTEKAKADTGPTPAK